MRDCDTALRWMETVLENVWRAEDGDEINRHEIEVAQSIRTG